MKSKDHICRTVQLTDYPAVEDQFGSHQPVAESVVDFIMSEEGGISIGLEGTWGSGKSTIVNLIKNKLENSSQPSSVFIFDAWAHEGDPLRRTFLESLIDDLLNKQSWLGDRKRWENEREKISKRITETTKHQTPSVKPLGLLFMLLTIASPLGLVITSWALRENNTFWTYLGVSISLLPLIISLFILVIKSIRFIYLLINEEEKAFKKTFEDLGTLFFQKSTLDIHTLSHEMPEPTSVEFSKVFSDVMENALGGDDRKLLLVFDNLDRVNISDAKSVLATMQTFIQNPEYSKFNWFQRMWMLIPYDRDGLGKLWDTFEEAVDEDSNIAQRFIEKTFQVRFYTPPIVLSDWDDYLKKLLKQAFPDHPRSELEFRQIFRLYDIERPSQPAPPTPRELKIFVNQTGSVHRINQDKFPLPHQAYFALLSLSGKDVINELRSENIPSREMVLLLGNEIRDSLAALAFNVDIPKGRELILLPQIEDALINGDGKKLQSIIERHPHGAYPIIERAKFNTWAGSNPINLAKSATALYESGLSSKAPKDIFRSILYTLTTAVKSIEQWGTLGQELGEGLSNLIILQKDYRDLPANLFSSITSSEFDQGADTTDEYLELWINTTRPIFDALAEIDKLKYLSEGIRIPNGAEWFVELSGYFYETDELKEIVRYIQNDTTGDEVSNYLVKKVKNSSLSLPIIKSFHTYNDLFDEINWPSIAKSVFDKLNGTPKLELPELEVLIVAIWELRPLAPNAGKLIGRLADSGSTLHHLHTAMNDKDKKLAAWFVFSHTQYRPDATQPSNAPGFVSQGWNTLDSALRAPSDNKKLLEAYYELVKVYEGYTQLVNIIDNNPNWVPWVSANTELAIEEGNTLDLLTPDRFLKYFKTWRSELDSGAYDKALAELVRNSNLVQTVREKPFSSLAAQVHIDMLQSNASSIEDYSTWLSDSLKEIDTSAWLDALRKETKLLDLLVVRYKRGKKFKLGLEYRDGVHDFAGEVIRGKTKPSSKYIMSRAFLKPVWGGDQETLKQRILNEVETVDGNVAAPFFDVFGPILLDKDLISQDRDVVLDLLEPLVRQRNPRGIKWLTKLFGKYPSLMEGYEPNHVVGEFTDRIAQALDDLENIPDDIAEELIKFANILDIDIPDGDSLEQN